MSILYLLLAFLSCVSPSLQAEGSSCKMSRAYKCMAELNRSDRSGNQPRTYIYVSDSGQLSLEVVGLKSLLHCQNLQVNAYDLLSTAVGFTAEQLPLSFTYIRGSQEYQSYHADALANVGVRIQSGREWYIREGASLVPAPEIYDHDRANATFVDALRQIQEAASKDLHNPAAIAAVSIPQHFNDSSAYSVMKALEDVEPFYKQPSQVIRTVRAHWMAHGLHTCEGLGLSHDTCDIDEDEHRIIMVEYRENYLQLFIVDVYAEAIGIENQARYNDLGENTIEDVVADANRTGRDRQRILHDDDSGAATIIEEQHNAKIEDTVSRFLMKSGSTYKYPGWWDDVRAVVISGDASESGLQRFRLAVDGALGQHKNLTREFIDPFYMDAMGAAQRGLQVVLNPDSRDVTTCLIESVGYEERCCNLPWARDGETNLQISMYVWAFLEVCAHFLFTTMI
ncbi:MAG: hypothetical protein Q9169_000050 [Polycauliona sp. 2 TL-2023]